jgi:hypothetical protein
MKKNNGTSSEDKFKDTLIEEIFAAILGFFGSDITTKIGYSILFVVIGLALLIAPVSGQENKHVSFFIIGGILLSIGIYLFISRIIERKKGKKE